MIDVGLNELLFGCDDLATPAFDPVNLNIPAASSATIVGTSETGNSTIAHLLLRF